MRIIASILLVLTLPFVILIAMCLYLEIKTNVIFKQKRVGKHKNEFVIYKFKTMENNQVTKVGRVIRKLGLDEIPQLLNIVKGEMAFVGPRPLKKYDIERLGWNTPTFSDRWNVLPGITGLAQLSKVCNADLAISNDLHYVKNKNFALDSKLFLKSLLVPFLGKHTQ